MTPLESALWNKILYIVEVEHRPFSYTDFVSGFAIDGKVHSVTHKTFRNKISALRKEGKIQVAYYSSQAFYTIKGIIFEKHSIDDRIGVASFIPQELAYVKNDPLYRSIRNLPFGQKSLHNIRLRFEAKGIWNAIHSSPCFTKCEMNDKSKDVTLPKIVIDNLVFHVNLHRTDTVSVIIACSHGPVAVDVDGVTRLSNALAAVKHKISHFVLASYNEHESGIVRIPDHMGWIVTMWHFGADALAEYRGEKDHRRWGIAEKILVTIYTKEWKGHKKRFRWDIQEYPNKAIKEALEEKLNACITGIGV